MSGDDANRDAPGGNGGTRPNGTGGAPLTNETTVFMSAVMGGPPGTEGLGGTISAGGAMPAVRTLLVPEGLLPQLLIRIIEDAGNESGPGGNFGGGASDGGVSSALSRAAASVRDETSRHRPPRCRSSWLPTCPAIKRSRASASESRPLSLSTPLLSLMLGVTKDVPALTPGSKRSTDRPRARLPRERNPRVASRSSHPPPDDGAQVLRPRALAPFGCALA